MPKAEPIGLRERKKQVVQQRLIDEAASLLSQHPLEDVKVEDICAAADVSRKTFYNYFPGKVDLIEALSDQLLLDESEKNFDKAMSSFNTTHERLICFLAEQGKNLADNFTLEKNLIKNAMLDMASNTDRPRKKLENNVLLFEKMFEAGREIGDVNDKYSPRFLAEMVAGAMNTSAIHWIHFPDYPVNERFKELMAFIEDMVLRS